MGIEACEEMPSYRAMELARQRIEEAQERAQQQAERDYHNSLLHRGPYYSIPATPYDACADCAPLR
jgi:hypothetical protein